MAQRNPTLRRVGIFIFSIAIFMGIILTLARVLPDLESTMYGFARFNYPRIRSFTCPVLMTTVDREPVTVKLSNPLDRPITWNVNTQFSTHVLISDTSERIELQPGESKQLSWLVGQENIDLGNFIFARVFASSSSSLPMRESTCGTLVLNLPIKGGPVIFYAALIVSVLGVALGLILWSRSGGTTDPGTVSQTWWMRFITIVVAIGLIAALLNSWFLALMMVLLAILSTAVFLISHKAGSI